MSDNGNQMTLALDVEQRLVNLGFTYTVGDSLSSTIRREAKRRYLEAHGRMPKPYEDRDGTLHEPSSAEVKAFIDSFRMNKEVKAESDRLFSEVRGITSTVVPQFEKYGYTSQITRINARGQTTVVFTPPSQAATLAARRKSAINITADVLSNLPADVPLTKEQLFKQLADAKVDFVEIKAKADKKAAEEAKKLAEANKAA